MPDASGMCGVLTPSGNPDLRCTFRKGHTRLNAWVETGDPVFDTETEYDHGADGVFWNVENALPPLEDSAVPIQPRSPIEVYAETPGDPGVAESYLAEPGSVEIRIAAVQAAATAYGGMGGSVQQVANDIIKVANLLETHILEAPS